MLRRAHRLIASITLLTFGTLSVVGPGAHHAPIFGLHGQCTNHHTHYLDLGDHDHPCGGEISKGCASTHSKCSLHKTSTKEDLGGPLHLAENVKPASDCQMCLFYAKAKLIESDSDHFVVQLVLPSEREFVIAAENSCRAAYLARAPPSA